MNFNEIERHVEIATLIEELERTFVDVEERRAEERATKSEVVFVRPSKVREVVYEHFSLYNHFESKKFMKKLSTNSRKLEFYVNSIVAKVCEFFKQYNLYRKPLPKELIERVVDYYANVVIANRRVYIITKNYSKRKRKIKTPTLQTQLPSRPSAREGLGHEVQGREVEGLGQTEAREGEATRLRAPNGP